MGFWKLSSFLALGFLILYQVGIFQAAPIRSAPEKESTPDYQALLNEDEADLLLAAMIKNYMMKVASELEQEQETEGSSITAQKRACNTGTCLTHKLAGLLSQTGSVANTNLLPPDMVAKGSGRKARDLDA